MRHVFKAIIFAIVPLSSGASYAETKTVTVDGKVNVCYSQERSQDLAKVNAENNANRECRALGDGWNYEGMRFSGYEQCSPCGKSSEFICTVTQAMYNCVSMKKDNAEKAAKARAEKEAAAKEAKAKADRERAEREAQQKIAREKAAKERADKEAADKVVKEKAEREKVEREAQKIAREKAAQDNSVDDAFAKLEKSKGGKPSKSGSSMDDAFAGLDKGKGSRAGQGVDAAFGDVTAHLAEVERQRAIQRAEEERKRAEVERQRLAELERIRQQPVRITNYHGGDSVNTRVVEISGHTQGMALNKTLMVNFNNTTQQVSTNEKGEFSTKVVLKSGDNVIQVCFENRCSSLKLVANIERLALMATLTWEGRGDLDLHVEAPSGANCSYQSKQKQGICTLDIDDTQGRNPENISVPLIAPKGTYRFWIVNYSGVSGVNGVLKLYQNELLVDTKNFVASGSRGSTEVSVDLANYVE